VPVINVEDLTWGGNGKTPMTKFLARRASSSHFYQGYGGGDEARMLQRHLIGTTTKPDQVQTG
jgi:tetraacyldisaccharide 4'-kinase